MREKDEGNVRNQVSFFLNYRSFILQFSNKYKQKIYIFQAVPLMVQLLEPLLGAGASPGI
jgi:hypothetical protein